MRAATAGERSTGTGSGPIWLVMIAID